MQGLSPSFPPPSLFLSLFLSHASFDPRAAGGQDYASSSPAGKKRRLIRRRKIRNFVPRNFCTECVEPSRASFHRSFIESGTPPLDARKFLAGEKYVFHNFIRNSVEIYGRCLWINAKIDPRLAGHQRENNSATPTASGERLCYRCSLITVPPPLPARVCTCKVISLRRIR